MKFGIVMKLKGRKPRSSKPMLDITIENQWNHLRWYVSGKPIRPEHGEVVLRLKLPDGWHIVDYEPVPYSVEDMGHSYKGLYWRPMVRLRQGDNMFSADIGTLQGVEAVVWGTVAPMKRA